MLKREEGWRYLRKILRLRVIQRIRNMDIMARRENKGSFLEVMNQSTLRWFEHGERIEGRMVDKDGL